MIQIVEVFAKTTRVTPAEVIDVCRKRLAEADRVVREARGKSRGEGR